MISHTKVILLKAIDYQDSSKILTVLSSEHGKIALIAKGAKRPKNKFTGLLDVGNILDVVYYYKANRGVQTLTEASVFYKSDIFRKDFQRAAVLYATLELVAQLVHDNEVNKPVFNFAGNFIQWLGESDTTFPSVFAYVQLRMAEIIGIGIHPDIENEANHTYLNVAGGSVSNSASEELSYKLTPAQSRFVLQGLRSKSKAIFNIDLENGELKQLVHHLDVYFKYHIDGYKERRSDTIFEQMI
ncbi:MAG: DNA repair protein RecO [Balneolaceae bacterium]|nr:DNA repair protein RecO [Balneolaceae bacterium]